MIGLRFLGFYIHGEGSGHVQSLILCAVLLNLSFLIFVLGVLADLIAFNRKIQSEAILELRKSKDH